MSYDRFNADNAAMLLFDHQVGSIEWVHSDISGFQLSTFSKSTVCEHENGIIGSV
jgi:hypothetical protein